MTPKFQVPRIIILCIETWNNMAVFLAEHSSRSYKHRNVPINLAQNNNISKPFTWYLLVHFAKSVELSLFLVLRLGCPLTNNQAYVRLSSSLLITGSCIDLVSQYGLCTPLSAINVRQLFPSSFCLFNTVSVFNCPSSTFPRQFKVALCSVCSYFGTIYNKYRFCGSFNFKLSYKGVISFSTTFWSHKSVI